LKGSEDTKAPWRTSRTSCFAIFVSLRAFVIQGFAAFLDVCYTAFARDERVRRPGDVLRGGSWNNNVENASALARNDNWNNNRNDNIGFRVVAAPASTFFRPFSGGNDGPLFWPSLPRPAGPP
jgi:hypothetical protein